MQKSRLCALQASLSTRSATRSGAFFSCGSATGGATKQTSFDGLPAKLGRTIVTTAPRRGTANARLHGCMKSPRSLKTGIGSSFSSAHGIDHTRCRPDRCPDLRLCHLFSPQAPYACSRGEQFFDTPVVEFACGVFPRNQFRDVVDRIGGIQAPSTSRHLDRNGHHFSLVHVQAY